MPDDNDFVDADCAPGALDVETVPDEVANVDCARNARNIVDVLDDDGVADADSAPGTHDVETTPDDDDVVDVVCARDEHDVENASHDDKNFDVNCATGFGCDVITHNIPL